MFLITSIDIYLFFLMILLISDKNKQMSTLVATPHLRVLQDSRAVVTAENAIQLDGVIETANEDIRVDGVSMVIEGSGSWEITEEKEDDDIMLLGEDGKSVMITGSDVLTTALPRLRMMESADDTTIDVSINTLSPIYISMAALKAASLATLLIRDPDMDESNFMDNSFPEYMSIVSDTEIVYAFVTYQGLETLFRYNFVTETVIYSVAITNPIGMLALTDGHLYVYRQLDMQPSIQVIDVTSPTFEDADFPISPSGEVGSVSWIPKQAGCPFSILILAVGGMLPTSHVFLVQETGVVKDEVFEDVDLYSKARHIDYVFDAPSVHRMTVGYARMVYNEELDTFTNNSFQTQDSTDSNAPVFINGWMWITHWDNGNGFAIRAADFDGDEISVLQAPNTTSIDAIIEAVRIQLNIPASTPRIDQRLIFNNTDIALNVLYGYVLPNEQTVTDRVIFTVRQNDITNWDSFTLGHLLLHEIARETSSGEDGEYPIDGGYTIVNFHGGLVDIFAYAKQDNMVVFTRRQATGTVGITKEEVTIEDEDIEDEDAVDSISASQKNEGDQPKASTDDDQISNTEMYTSLVAAGMGVCAAILAAAYV